MDVFCSGWLMRSYILREIEDKDWCWHSIGGKHERMCFNLIDLVGYHSVSHNDAPPFRLYWPAGSKLEPLPVHDYRTVDDAREAGRLAVLDWLRSAGRSPIAWQPHDSGVHWTATADGIEISSYYYCAKKTGRFRPGFTVWFGATYFVVSFESPEAARAEVERTWRIWLSIAKARFLEHEPD